MANPSGYEATGILAEIYPTESKGTSGNFQVREFVLEIPSNGDYKEYIKFQAVQDKTSELDKFRMGQAVTVTFDLKGRPFTDKTGQKRYFSNLQAWKIEIAAEGALEAQASQGAPREQSNSFGGGGGGGNRGGGGGGDRGGSGYGGGGAGGGRGGDRDGGRGGDRDGGSGYGGRDGGRGNDRGSSGKRFDHQNEEPFSGKRGGNSDSDDLPF